MQRFWGVFEEVVLGHVCQKIGGHEAAAAIQLADKEAVVVHLAEYDDHVAGAERQFDLAVDVRRELRRIVIVKSKLASENKGREETSLKNGRYRIDCKVRLTVRIFGQFYTGN